MSTRTNTPSPAVFGPSPPSTPGTVYEPHGFEVGEILLVNLPELLIHGLNKIPVDQEVLNEMLNLPTHPAVVMSTSFDPEILIIVMVSCPGQLVS